jgi:hypothetical protein
MNPVPAVIEITSKESGMPEEYKQNDDQPTEPYTTPHVPYHSDASSMGDSSAASSNEDTLRLYHEPSPSYRPEDSAQLPDYARYFQAGPVPLAAPLTPASTFASTKKRGFHFSLKNILILALILLLILAGGSALFVYLTRSTPGKTLDAFCSALVQSDYQHAYQQFGPTLQRSFSEKIFADTLARDRITQCTYTAVGEAPQQVQTGLTLLHGSEGANNDQVMLDKDAHGTWLITNLQVARPNHIPQQAAVHHLTLTANHTLNGLATIFAANGGGSETNLAVTAGERVVVLASGKVSMTPNGQQVGADGGSSCPTNSLPEPQLNCLTLIYSLGSIDQVNEAGTRADFTVQAPGILFLGLNVPYPSQAHGSFQLTVLTIPDGTATALWQQPDHNNFLFSQTGTLSLSAQIFAQHYADHVSGVHFYLVGAQGAETPICDASYDGFSAGVNCSWDLKVGEETSGIGTPISNGPVTIGFSLQTTDATAVTNPDGTISGTVRYISDVRSDNYSGYAAQSIDQPQPTHYRSARMSWSVPLVQCAAGETSASGIWAGMTGISDKSQLAQTGTASGCQNGSPIYYAWWEMFPAPAHLIAMSLQPGDQMTANVNYQSGQFQLTLDNTSEHDHFSTTQSGSDNDTLLAECIVEAPAFTNSTLAPLSNFGTVSASCQANNQPIGVTGPQNLVFQMVGTQQHATTSNLDAQGTNFTVQWKSS